MMNYSINGVYWFPISSVTNYHEFSALKEHKFIILQFCKSEAQNQP